MNLLLMMAFLCSLIAVVIVMGKHGLEALLKCIKDQWLQL